MSHVPTPRAEAESLAWEQVTKAVVQFRHQVVKADLHLVLTGREFLEIWTGVLAKALVSNERILAEMSTPQPQEEIA